uniref:Uncharacterized protein n=1 Tax=Panagrolaimus davidi TaxID=227884 RepID=A0A914R0W8_9BILA
MERDTVNGQLSDAGMQTTRPTSTLLDSPTVSTTSIISDTIEHEPTTDNKILQSLSKLKTVNSNAAQSQFNRVAETQPLNNDNFINPIYASKKDNLESKAAADMTSQKLSQETTAKAGPSNDTKIENLNHERNSTARIGTSFLPTKIENQIAEKTDTVQLTSTITASTSFQNHTFQPSQSTVADSPFISNIGEELKFIENERNRSEESVSNGPSKILIFQNAMDEERVQVGVQVASKISKSNKPTNPGIEIINIESNENGMGFGQKLSQENVVVPQLPSSSRASKADQNLQPFYNFVGEQAAVKVVVTYPVVSFIENEYKILDWKEWPQLPKDIKIVTVSGPHASGRTSFIHSLIYFWGYKLLKEQVITSKLRIGMHFSFF